MLYKTSKNNVKCFVYTGNVLGNVLSLGILSICQTGHFVIKNRLLARRQHGPVVRVPDLKYLVPRFKCPLQITGTPLRDSGKQIIKFNRLKIPTGRRHTSWLYTSMTEEGT